MFFCYIIVIDNHTIPTTTNTFKWRKNMAQTYKQILGQAGETCAANFLQTKGHVLLERNWRGRYGELDIVSLDNGTLVFSEVKTRANAKFGMPQQAVTPAKQKRLCKAALEYLCVHDYAAYNMRFDVLALTKTVDGYRVEWFPNAFEFYADADF